MDQSNDNASDTKDVTDEEDAPGEEDVPDTEKAPRNNKLSTFADHIDSAWDDYSNKRYPSFASSPPLNKLRLLFARHTRIPQILPLKPIPLRGSVIKLNLIGLGSTSVVLEIDGTSYVWKKRNIDGRQDSLWDELVYQLKVYEVFATLNRLDLPLVPKPRAYYNPKGDGGQLWNMVRSLNADLPYGVPTDMLLVDQIPPLCKAFRKAAWDIYGAKDEPFEDATPCIAQLRLGCTWSEHQKEGKHFSLIGCKIYGDQMFHMCPFELPLFAKEIGRALAVLHWAVKVDGYDVKFYLGGWPTSSNISWCCHHIVKKLPPRTTVAQVTLDSYYPKRPVHLWMTGFGRCKPITMDAKGVDAALEAAQLTIEAIPRPRNLRDEMGPLRVWNSFYAGYWEASKAIFPKGHQLENLPMHFIKKWQRMYVPEPDEDSGGTKRKRQLFFCSSPEPL